MGYARPTVTTASAPGPTALAAAVSSSNCASAELYIEQAIHEERDRQQAFEQEIDQDRDNDLGYGIE